MCELSLLLLSDCPFPTVVSSASATTTIILFHYKEKPLNITSCFLPSPIQRRLVLNRWANTEGISKWAGRRCTRWRLRRRRRRPRLPGLGWKTFREWPGPPAPSSSASASSPSPPFLSASWPQPPISRPSPPSGEHFIALISRWFNLLFGIRV